MMSWLLTAHSAHYANNSPTFSLTRKSGILERRHTEQSGFWQFFQ